MLELDFKEQLKKLPAKPGIYLFKNSHKKPLYIGKALNLKNRVNSYLKTSDPRLQKMVAETKTINFIETESDIEALILESQYIKKYQPAFNIMLRDDKQYFYVVFTEEKFSRIFLSHQPHKFQIPRYKSQTNSNYQNSKKDWDLGFGAWDFHSAPAEWFGPFTDGNALKTTLRLLRKIFPYCTCRQLHNNYCLNYHIGKCPGFCCLKNPELRIMNNELREYGRNIKAIKDILSGKKTSLIKNLEKEMKDLSDKQEFEKARELQYKIEKLKRVFQNAQIIATGSKQQAVSKILSSLKDSLRLDKLPRRIECYDIANIQGRHAVGAMVVFTDDQPDKNEYRKFKIYSKNTADDTAMLKEVLIRRFNHPEWQYPDLIIVDGGKGQLNTALAVLRESRISNLESRIRLVALTKNEKHIGHKVILTNGKETRPNVPRQNDIHVGLTFGTGEVLLSKLPVPVKNLLLQIDGEAHRFAINYYRKLHSKSLK